MKCSEMHAYVRTYFTLFYIRPMYACVYVIRSTAMPIACCVPALCMAGHASPFTDEGGCTVTKKSELL